ncbi:MAG: sulfite exporter TauE/SafE family protein [Stackebrandtia sp.]
MDLAQAALLVAAGIAAGAINAVAGGGSLLSYPALLAVGVPPVSANVTNALSVAPGYFASALGSGADLRAQRRRALSLIPTAALGTGAGTAILLATPETAFQAIVPFLVIAASLLTAFGPWIRKAAGASEAGGGTGRLIAVHLLTGLACVYGGYFNAALGLVLAAVLGLTLGGALARTTALKNAVAAVVGVVTSVVYGLLVPVDWLAVGVLLPATLAGGYGGARVARRISEPALRISIVAFGLTVGVYLLLR